MGHREHHVPLAAVLEPHQLRADLVVPPALLPHLGGVHDRHLHLLAADRVQLLADDLLDALVDPEAERQQRVDAGAQLAHVPRPQQQAVGRHLRLGGVVAERREEQVGQAHGAKDTGAGARVTVTAGRRCATGTSSGTAGSASPTWSSDPADRVATRTGLAATAGTPREPRAVERLAGERRGDELRVVDRGEVPPHGVHLAGEALVLPADAHGVVRPRRRAACGHRRPGAPPGRPAHGAAAGTPAAGRSPSSARRSSADEGGPGSEGPRSSGVDVRRSRCRTPVGHARTRRAAERQRTWPPDR